MERTMKAASLGRALRQERNLKVRQPLAALRWVVPGEEISSDELAPFLRILAAELNIKEITFHTDDSELVTLSATANFSTLGPRVGRKMKDIASAIAALPENTIAEVEDGGSHEIDSVVITNDDIKVRRIEKPGLALKSDGFMTVALETDLTDELMAEGLVREFVHLVQNERKTANLELTERIILHVWIPETSELLRSAITHHEDYIRRETLATKILTEEARFEGTKLKANGLEFILRVERTPA